MRCRRTRTAVTEQRLGLLSEAQAAELHRHLDECAACAAERRYEQSLAGELAILREAPAIKVDVRRRVMREIAGLGPVDRREVPAWQFGWAALTAAGALAAAVVVGWVAFPPLLPEAIRETRSLVGGVGAIASALSAPLAGLLIVLQSLGRVALDMLETASHLLEKLAVLNQAMMALSIMMMIAITTYVVARDLRLLPEPPWRKEP